MDNSNIDHSDSDSGESWTLIENNSNYADDVSEMPENPTESVIADNDKDEDTDGISIITDSEPESSSPCQMNYENYLTEENCTTVHHIPQFIAVDSDLNDIKNNHESEKEDDDFLGESGRKHKTYVHRRNKRLSTVLNIIMLGSVITAAGIAIGHMWGAKTDCSMHASTNVNKILSNLYKLQEENAYLWSKLKELTALNNYQMSQQKTTLKQNKCKKMFEEPLTNNEGKRVTKCVDDKFFSSEKLINSPMVEAAKKEKSDEFLNETEDMTNERKSYADSLKDFGKVKTFNIKDNPTLKPRKKYLSENNKILQKSDQIATDSSFSDTDKLVNVNKKEYYLKNNKKLEVDYGYEINVEDKKVITDFSQQREDKSLYDDFTSYESHQNIKRKENNKTLKVKEKKNSGQSLHDEVSTKKEFLRDKDKILKYENNNEGKNTMDNKEFDKIKLSNNKNNGIEKNIVKTENNAFNKDKKIHEDNQNLVDSSEEDFKKDNRYVSHKQKPKGKKNGQQQKNKKNKKRNKYEQWEMKGGVFRDYDDISLTSSQDKEYLFNKPNLLNDKIFIRNLGHNNNIDNNFDATTDNDNDEINWLDKRAKLRKEARLKLEQESFDKNSVNAAGWYFRRMRKREQSRGKSDNSTHRKLLKRNMNYKLKH
ncbi:unnamed protein product [Euphydryas editha]|uniref:Uncharacterized protein n=1 Tax=Euphydryas editha TaxID=104508 RepID=A0AAU9TMS7_EUPED|nr:unnamed protein product [Euphydryas editha]